MHHDAPALPLDLRILTSVLQPALQRDRVTLDTWHAQRIPYATVGPDSRQLGRLSGTTRDGEPTPWSLVRKVSPAPVQRTAASVATPF